MARKKQSVLEDVMDIAAHLPWQAGIGLAMLAYLVLHYLAMRSAMTMNPVELKAMGKTVGDGVVHGVIGMLAGILQYLVPFALLLGAMVSFWRGRRQAELHLQVAGDASGDALNRMSWRDFEGLTAEAFRRKGYRVVERGGDGPDGGVDLVLFMGRDKYLVQCKQWKAMKVGVAVVRELYGVMTAEHAVGGFVVASGEFTADALAFAVGRSITLVPARSLRKMVENGATIPADRKIQPVSPEVAVPACPKCGKPMVSRIARQGSRAGQSFWGCGDFPTCSGVRSR